MRLALMKRNWLAFASRSNQHDVQRSRANSLRHENAVIKLFGTQYFGRSGETHASSAMPIRGAGVPQMGSVICWAASAAPCLNRPTSGTRISSSACVVEPLSH